MPRLCPFMSQTDDVILILLYAGIVAGLLGLFGIGFKQLPLKL